MRKIIQDKFVKKNEAGEIIERGNCFASCIACIMDIPLNQVPNVEELFFIDGGYWWEVMLTWLTAKGWELTGVNMDYINSVSIPNGDYYLVTGKSPRGDFNHICIYQHGRLFHDTHPDGTGIEGEPTHYEILEKTT